MSSFKRIVNIFQMQIPVDTAGIRDETVVKFLIGILGRRGHHVLLSS